MSVWGCSSSASRRIGQLKWCAVFSSVVFFPLLYCTCTHLLEGAGRRHFLKTAPRVASKLLPHGVTALCALTLQVLCLMRLKDELQSSGDHIGDHRSGTVSSLFSRCEFGENPRSTASRHDSLSSAILQSVSSGREGAGTATLLLHWVILKVLPVSVTLHCFWRCPYRIPHFYKPGTGEGFFERWGHPERDELRLTVRDGQSHDYWGCIIVDFSDLRHGYLPRTLDVVLEICREEAAKSRQGDDEVCDEQHAGHVLVFLPSYVAFPVERLVSNLRSYRILCILRPTDTELAERGLNERLLESGHSRSVQILQLHGRQQPDDQQLVFEKCPSEFHHKVLLPR